MQRANSQVHITQFSTKQCLPNTDPTNITTDHGSQIAAPQCFPPFLAPLLGCFAAMAFATEADTNFCAFAAIIVRKYNHNSTEVLH